MKSPLFSIITVCYNAEHVISFTLNSVKEQSCTDYEYIIIDGASKDNTLQQIKSFRPIISHLITEPDRGLYDAMNKGINVAKGIYLIFLNAGDAFHSKETLEEIRLQLPSDSLNYPDILYGETALVDSNRQFIDMRRLKAPKKLNWKSFRMGMLVCHQAFIAKREIAPLYDLQYGFSADFDWCIRCMKKARILQHTHLVLINYLHEGLTTQNHKKSLKERYRIMVKYYGRISTALLHLWFAIRYYCSKLFKGYV